MNRVYKVIWSKAKHCYVVTSEIAKSHTKGESTGRGLKKLAAALLVAAALMGPNFAWAADGTATVMDKSSKEQIVYTQEGADVKFATKTELAAKANADDVESTYAKTADVANTYVNKTKAEVTYLTVSGDVEAHGNLKVGNDNFKVDGSTGNVTTGSAAIGGALTVDGDTEIDGDLGVTGNLFAGGYTETDAKAALNADGSIKGAEGKFTVGTDGKVTAASGKIGTVDITSDGALTGMKSLGVENIYAGGTITGNKLTDGVASLQAGNLNTTGNINAHDINAHDIVATGDISGKAISGTTITGTTITGTSLNTQNGAIIGGAITGTTITATGKISTGGDVVSTGGKVQGTSVSDGTATLSGGSLKNAVDINASGTITGNNVVVNNKLTTEDLEVKGGLETDHMTLGSEPLNYTKIDMGNVTSKVLAPDGGVYYGAESIFNKDGSSITVRTNEGSVDSTGNSTVGWKEIIQYLGNNAVPDVKNVTRRMVRNDDGTFSMVDTAVDGKDKYSIVSQNAGERKVTVVEGTKNLNVTENLTNGIVSETNGGAGKTVTLTQGMDGTYKVETSGTSTEEISGQKIENYKGGLDTNITGNETHDVSGNMTTTVTGDSSLKAENITNEAKNKITNKARDVETDAASSIVSKVSNAAGSNTSTQWSYQTKEEMSQTDGKTASYLRGAAEEKSQLTDGDKKTTIDTVAGQTNTNITEGKNVSNSLQEANQIASSVTDGTNTTVVNQDAKSLASSITDGTGKVNNTNNTVDKSEQLIKVDDTHFYAETRTAGSAVEALKSDGNTIISAKDAVTGTVSSAVTDGPNTTGSTMTAKGITNSAAESIVNEIGDGSAVKSEMTAKGITNTAKSGTITNDAKDLVNTASNSITDKVGENVERTMGTKKIEESVKDGTKSNTFTKTAKKDMNIITDGTNTSTLSQLADKVNTSLKEVDGAGNTTKSLNNVKTVSEDTTKMTDTASGEFSKRSQTVSQIQDKVGKTTVTTIDGKTTLTDEDHNHTTEMDYANVTKDLSVYRNTTLGEEGEDTILTVNSTSTFKDTVKMEKTLEVDGESTFNNKVTITKGGLDVKGGTTTDTLTVTGTSEFRGKADFKDNVSMGKGLAVAGETKTGTLHVEKDGYVGGNLNVAGNIETHDAVLSADSRQVVTGRQLYQTNERVDKLDNRIKKVGANAAALAALRPGDFNPDDKFSIAAGFGSYRNANAAALGLFYRPNENVLLSLGTSFGDGENMVNAGVSVKFGRGKSMAERRKEMADEVSSMRDEMRSQDERIAELEEMLKKQSELIEKLSKES